MLLAALSSLHAKLHSAGDTQRCQVLQTAMSLFATKFQALLLSSDPARELVPPASWLQVPLAPHNDRAYGKRCRLVSRTALRSDRNDSGKYCSGMYMSQNNFS